MTGVAGRNIKKRRLYDRKVTRTLTKSLAQAGRPCNLYIIDIRLTEPLSAEENLKNRRIIDPVGPVSFDANKNNLARGHNRFRIHLHKRIALDHSLPCLFASRCGLFCWIFLKFLQGRRKCPLSRRPLKKQLMPRQCLWYTNFILTYSKTSCEFYCRCFLATLTTSVHKFLYVWLIVLIPPLTL